VPVTQVKEKKKPQTVPTEAGGGSSKKVGRPTLRTNISRNCLRQGVSGKKVSAPNRPENEKKKGKKKHAALHQNLGHPKQSKIKKEGGGK